MSVATARPSARQDALLLALERRLQLRAQEQSRALLPPAPPSASLRGFRAAQRPRVGSSLSQPSEDNAVIVRTFAGRVDASAADGAQLLADAQQAAALVEHMESSHAQVAATTRALYDSFESVLQQVEALTARVDAVAAPLPYFTVIDRAAQALGFGVKFAPASGGSTQASAVPPVQVFQHKRSIDPTAKAFADALETIDASVAYLEQHPEYRDAASYIDAYRALSAGGVQCLKEYAVNGLEAAKDAVVEALARAGSGHPRGLSPPELDEAAPYYVHFQLVAPALAVVAKQLERLATAPSAMSNPAAHAANLRALRDVCDAYATQRVQLLSPVLSAAFVAASQSTDIVSLLRVSCAHLVKVCDAEFRLFWKLFGREPRDALFAFRNDSSVGERDDDDGDTETPFERMILQLSALLYNVVRPQMLQQKELEVLCEVIQVLQSEVVESLIQPRAATAGATEPVMHRMVQDAQERLILCVQKFIRDEIEGFAPTAADLDYPTKLLGTAAAAGSMYATWYPTLERTLLCLSRVYHFVNDAIQICTASLKLAAADLSASKGTLHGALFLVKHLLTLREQITPFDVALALTNKALDFTSSADAMSHLLAGVATIFSFSLHENALVGLFVNAIPQVHETTSDVKKELELELKKSCAAFIDEVLQQTAQPLLALMKQIAAAQAAALRANAPLDFRQFAAATPAEVSSVLGRVSAALEARLPDILATIHLYLRNSSTETILFKPVQRNLLDAVEGLKALLEQAYSLEERQPCERAFTRVVEQLRAL
ncbi:hypothetical protein PybrP1_002158 [[Pythium] brassicae (nom. inval.)]|nr:hypothetical protein PybrP1_002158 [[Pythium] brassicae (nom. inval.)]